MRDAVRLQEAIGLDVISDGEMRRLNFQDSFGAAVEGYDASVSTLQAYARRVEGGTALRRWEVPVQEKGTAISHRRPVTSRLKLKRNVPLEEYKFVAGVAKTPAKVSLIGPDRIGQRFDHQNSKAVYKDMDAFMADVVAIEREIVGLRGGGRLPLRPHRRAGLHGLRRRALDEPDARARRGPGGEFHALAQGRCRGDRGLPRRHLRHSPLPRQPAQHVAPRGQLRRDRRAAVHGTAARPFPAGIRQPARRQLRAAAFLPKGKVAVLGLVSTKVPELETVDALKRRIDEAAKVLPLEQLAISPQCGFASDVVGNLITPDDQKRKLERVVETARQVWG